ncbi:MAG: ABC transporter permease [Armatimonadia bacterium]
MSDRLEPEPKTVAPSVQERAAGWRQALARIAPLAFLVVLCLVFGALNHRFFAVENLVNIPVQISVIAVIAIGETFVIAAAGIDLSVGSMVALTGVTSALLMTRGVPAPVAALAGVGMGLFWGLVSGGLITRAKLPAFIVTLGVMGIARGLALALSKDQTISGLPDDFTKLGSVRLFGVLPLLVVVMLVVAVVAHFVLTRTRLGRYAYAMGSNLEATRLSGVNTQLYMTLLFVVCGGLAGLGGVMETARTTIGQPTGGELYELDSIAAAVIGGASLNGGQGTVAGTLIGAFIMAVLRNGCNLLVIPPSWQRVFIGAIIILAVLYDNLRQRRLSR